MPYVIDDLMSQVMRYEAPQEHPGPKDFHYRVQLDEFVLDGLRRDPERTMKRLKSAASAALARHIADNTTFFEVQPDLLLKRREFEIELSINDRGAYEHWLPEAKRLGISEGLKRAEAAKPYGLDEVYE